MKATNKVEIVVDDNGTLKTITFHGSLEALIACFYKDGFITKTEFEQFKERAEKDK